MKRITPYHDLPLLDTKPHFTTHINCPEQFMCVDMLSAIINPFTVVSSEKLTRFCIALLMDEIVIEQKGLLYQNILNETANRVARD